MLHTTIGLAAVRTVAPDRPLYLTLGCVQVYLVQGTDTATGQNVGLLTRVDPIVAMQRYQEGS